MAKKFKFLVYVYDQIDREVLKGLLRYGKVFAIYKNKTEADNIDIVKAWKRAFGYADIGFVIGDDCHHDEYDIMASALYNEGISDVYNIAGHTDTYLEGCRIGRTQKGSWDQFTRTHFLQDLNDSLEEVEDWEDWDLPIDWDAVNNYDPSEDEALYALHEEDEWNKIIPLAYA